MKTAIRASIVATLLVTSFSFIPGAFRHVPVVNACTNSTNSWYSNDGRIGTALHELAPCTYQVSEDTYYVNGGPLGGDYLEAIAYGNGQVIADSEGFQVQSTSTGYRNFTCGNVSLSGEGKQWYGPSGAVLDDVTIPGNHC